MHNNITSVGKWKRFALLLAGAVLGFGSPMHNTVAAQAPGTTPIEVSLETQMLHGRKYYVHIVKTGQTVYSISRAYKVQSYDAVTHVDIHFLHAGDTVWLPVRGQFSEAAVEAEAKAAEAGAATPTTTPTAPAPSVVPPAKTPQPAHEVRKVGKTVKVALMMPLHLDQMDQVSTSKFDVEQRGKKVYRQFEFIEFYEGILLALEQMGQQGISVELNVVDVTGNTAAAVEEAFRSHNVAQSDVLVTLLFRDAFARAAELAQQAGVYIVNPMATRSDICADNPYVVKLQPSLEGQVSLMLKNMKAERPNAHLYIIHSGTEADRAVREELKRQLDERKDIKYTLFNWSQSAKLASTLKATPDCNVVSIYAGKNDQMRIHVSTLLNRLSAFKNHTPTLYTLTDWTVEYGDIDFSQLQLLNYHTFNTSWDMTNQVHTDFLKAWRDRYATEPVTQLAAIGYDLSLYIIGGLAHKGADFWQHTAQVAPQGMLQPMHLVRSGQGLENDRAQLYRMDDLRFVAAPLK